MTTSLSELYGILGVAQGASFEQVKTAYRRKALELHPDKNPEDSRTATANFQTMKTAYDHICRIEEKRRRQEEEETRNRQKMEEEEEDEGPEEGEDEAIYKAWKERQARVEEMLRRHKMRFQKRPKTNFWSDFLKRFYEEQEKEQ